nr:uncharacterized protein LOC113801295 [Penaeus vannamei]
MTLAYDSAISILGVQIDHRLTFTDHVRPVMEYCPLVWSCCPPSYLRLLDRVQIRAQRLVSHKTLVGERQLHFQPLQHRREVAALCVFYKVHRLRVSHLTSLRLEPRAAAAYETRHSSNRGQELQVPFSRTELNQRSFQPRYSRLWNTMVQQTSLYNLSSLQAFKAAVHRWRSHDPG